MGEVPLYMKCLEWGVCTRGETKKKRRHVVVNVESGRGKGGAFDGHLNYVERDPLC